MTPEALIRTARAYEGHREVRPNSSPLIDHWLQMVGQPPGEPWCAAFVCACIAETDPGLGFLRSASALKLISRNPDRKVRDPEPGRLVIWDRGHGEGHVAIVTGVIWVRGNATAFTAIAGNTSEDGRSREGVMVKEHSFDLPDPQIAGYLDVCTPEQVA